METAFTPIASLAGGALIGLAAVLLMLIHGRIAGATGILAGVLLPTSRENWAWRAAMLVGMASAPGLFSMFMGTMPAIEVPVSAIALLIGGFIVGIGVTLGSGCTSGHGVCGIARLSPRSIAATAIFMLVAFTTVYVVRHVMGG